MPLKTILGFWIQPLIFLLAFSGTGMAQSYQPGVGFAIVGIAAGETERVNALNLGNGSRTGHSSCAVTLQFLDIQGKSLKKSVTTLSPGSATSLDLRRDEIGGDSRLEIRAVVLFGYSGGANPAQGILDQFDCNIVPSLEVYDTKTGRTIAILMNATTLPPPATPAQ